MLNWLKENKRFIKIRAIEQELKMPNSTLVKHINRSQKMSEEWQEKVSEFIGELRHEPNTKLYSAGICDSCTVPKLKQVGGGDEPTNKILYCKHFDVEIVPLPESEQISECDKFNKT